MGSPKSKALALLSAFQESEGRAFFTEMALVEVCGGMEREQVFFLLPPCVETRSAHTDQTQSPLEDKQGSNGP